MSGRPAARRSAVPTRRSGSVRRASAGVSRSRAGAALAVLLASGAIYGVCSSSAFDLTTVDVTGTTFSDQGDIQAAIDGVAGHNLFTLQTGPLEAALRDLPTIQSASVTVKLPNTVAISLKERAAVMVWKVGARRYLAGSDGELFARVTDATPETGAGLPVVEDRRASSAGLYLGARLDTVDLDAATRLASLVPADVGSGAEHLVVWVTDENGFIVRARPASWTAVFGYYTASLRTPELIPGQVRLLRSLLYGRESQVERVILASDTDGTYIAVPTPEPSA